MYKISKIFKFEMSHRLSLHQSLCRNIHGHSYQLEVGVKSESLNENGMVIDFSDLKSIVNEVIGKYDHSIMLNHTDHPIEEALTELLPDLRVTMVDYEPTAENMAREIYFAVERKLVGDYLSICMDFVSVWETDTSKATYC